MVSFETSNHLPSSLKISVTKNSLQVQHVPEKLRSKELAVSIKDKDGNEIIKEHFDNGAIIRTISLSTLKNGKYTFGILFKFGDNYWSNFVGKQGPIIIKKAGKCEIELPMLSIKNGLTIHTFPTTSQFLSTKLVPEKNIQCDHKEIKECAERLSKGHLFAYTKMLAVHDFVAENIAYDYDAFKNGSYRTNDNSALATLRERHGVCQGYANLSVALLRAMGIPSMAIKCFSLGTSTNGGWEAKENKERTYANHVFTAAFINGSWKVMDVTWDSDKKYSDKKFCDKTGRGVTHRYFDPTNNMLALSHKIIIDAIT